MANIYTSLRILSSQLRKSHKDFIKYLFQESDARGLGIFRILFGLCMFLDVFQERGLEDADIRFGNSNHCFFPLFPIIKPVSVQVACLLYSLMWIGSLGMMLGYKFKTSCFLFLMPFLYFLLLDKSRWNNHSYLFALTVILLSGSNATAFLSLENFLQRKSCSNEIDMKAEATRVHKCPRWNYYILRFQFTLLYFFAAVKKIDADWLSGYSMRNVSKHPILSPASEILGEDFLAYYVIHLGGFAYDLLAGFMLNFHRTKTVAFLLSFLFHGLNSQLFEIGMFPYVCVSSLTLFCSPEVLQLKWLSPQHNSGKRLSPQHNSGKLSDTKPRPAQSKAVKQCTKCKVVPVHASTSTNGKQEWITLALITYMSLQITLPFTHSFTKGYNNWTKGLYGYSWDMMLHSWDTLHTTITVKDYVTGTERYLDPNVWTTNERWSSHADMAKQYAECIARNLAAFNVTTIQVYFDVWKSLNGRFQQRIFDPRVDILRAPWSPWEEVKWILPLLHEFSNWRREVFEQISKHVGNWTTSSNVIFVADYPGLTLENYLPPQLSNVSLILMKGEIILEQTGFKNVSLKTLESDTFNPSMANNRVSIITNSFHKIHTVAQIPSCYMYTYTNTTQDSQTHDHTQTENIPLCVILINKLWNFLQDKWNAFTRSFYLILNSYLNIIFDVPMVLRKTID